MNGEVDEEEGVSKKYSKRAERENTYLAQVAEMGKLPSEAPLICNLRAFGATERKDLKQL